MSTSTSASAARSAPPASGKPLIEIGFVLAGQLDAIDKEAIEVARHRVAEDLQRRFPEFLWKLTSVARKEMTTPHREEPVAFLSHGQTERDLHKWDFVLVITNADLIGHDKPFALATVSRTLDLAVLSTARIDPHAVDASADRELRVLKIAGRMSALTLRCLGHLNGLDAVEDRTNFMWDSDEVGVLDELTELTDVQVGKMETNLHAIADLRLEEESDVPVRSTLAFLVRAAWTQRREILAGALEAKPWQFPVRLSRLTAAAASAMLILLMTAETWDMAMNQPAPSAFGLVLVAVVLTTVSIVTRQQLLVRRQDRLLTEQIAVSNMTSVAIVLCGLLTTLISFFITSLALSRLLFSESVVAGWAVSVDGPVSLRHYLRLSSVVSGFSLCIGALGAAFEDQTHFRHVIFVDEEL